MRTVIDHARQSARRDVHDRRAASHRPDPRRGSTRVIIDAAFDGVVPDYQPLATVEVDIGGNRHSLYERTVTITGLSKGHQAIGPYKIGAAITVTRVGEPISVGS